MYINFYTQSRSFVRASCLSSRPEIKSLGFHMSLGGTHVHAAAGPFAVFCVAKIQMAETSTSPMLLEDRDTMHAHVSAGCSPAPLKQSPP